MCETVERSASGPSILRRCGRQPVALAAQAISNMVFVPSLGKMLPKPMPPQENLRLVEAAKQAILQELEKSPTVSLDKLRAIKTITPAALNSALLALKKEGVLKSRSLQIIRQS